MQFHHQAKPDKSQGHEGRTGGARIVPNPKFKWLDQVREVMRLKHYSLHTERSYCDWIRRYVKFHGMRSRVDLGGAEPIKSSSS